MEDQIHIILYGKKVNVTKWATSHPGGKAILAAFHNRDGTEQFEVVHSKEAKDQLNSVFLAKSPVYVPSEAKEDKTTTRSTVNTNGLWNGPSTTAKAGPVIYDSKIATDFLQFKKELEEKGLFKTNVLAELLMLLYTLTMVIGGYYLTNFVGYVWTGVVMMGLGCMQAGWVAHDYLHHAVLPSVYWNDVVGLWIGTLQGYDGNWWKNRHNPHHMLTNEVLHDPDISIAPILHFVQQYPDLKSTLKHIQKYQHLYALPLFAFLDLAWRYESYNTAKAAWNKDKTAIFKLMSHYVFVLYMFSVVGFWPLLGVSFIRGFMTALIVFASHYTEERYVSAVPANFSLCEQTARTTRNINGGFFMNFISGNIALQIEHHLFPQMPPHNLQLAAPYVKKFFADHNLQYEESSIWECAKRIVDSLDMNAPAPPAITCARAKQS